MAVDFEMPAIEDERRDLAGARLIFYTDTDADRFFQSSLIFENFDVERDDVDRTLG